jgi:hypothetical protein
MRKAFQLRWAHGRQARIHKEGEWQLRFRDGSAHEFADKRLSLDKWLSVKNASTDETIYTFQRQVIFADCLDDLLGAGLPESDIELVCAECENPATVVRQKISDSFSTDWPLCEDHLKQFDDAVENLLGEDPSSE